MATATLTKTKNLFTSARVIELLKQNEFKVYVRHVRNEPDVGSNPREGSTQIRLEYGSKLFQGFSYCHPNDNFCKETGRKLALKKALEEVKRTDPDLRKQISELQRNLHLDATKTC